MKKAGIASLLSMFVLLVGLAGAAIDPSTGGTEDFEGMTLADEAVVTVPDLPTNWDFLNVDDDPTYYYDTSKGGGTLDTATWSVAAGLTKPSSTASIKMNCLKASTTGWRWIYGPEFVDQRAATYTFWFGVGATPTGGYIIVTEILFFGSGSHIRVIFEPDTSPQQVSFRTMSVGSPDLEYTNKTTVNLQEWNKIEIAFATSATSYGTMSIKLNDVEQLSGATIIDSGGYLTDHRLACYAHRYVTAGTTYLDDVSVILGTAVNDWMMFD